MVAPELTKNLQKAAFSGAITHCQRAFEVADAGKYWLVIAATADSPTNRQVAEAADDAGRFCNVVDDNLASGFILPAIVDRSPVVIAIGTEGTAPVLAQQLKTKIEVWLPSRIGELAQSAGRWRGLVKKRIGSAYKRRRFWQGFFDGPIAAHLLAGRSKEASALMRAELIGDTLKDTPDAGEAWIVGAGPGDPELITLRAQRLISRADVVVYDRLVSATVLDYARKEADLISVGKSSGKATLSQAEINELLVRLVRDGKRVCRLKGGDPFIFGRGGEEALALAAAGLTFQIVPGISAALGCAATAGIPLTLRGVSGSVTLATGLLDEDLLPDWPLLLNGGHTLCLYMSVGAIATMTDALISANVDPDLPVAIVENGTTSKQRTIFSSVSALKTDAERLRVQSPSILFLGRSIATARDLQWYEGGSIAPAFSSSIELDPLAAIA